MKARVWIAVGVALVAVLAGAAVAVDRAQARALTAALEGARRAGADSVAALWARDQAAMGRELAAANAAIGAYQVELDETRARETAAAASTTRQTQRARTATAAVPAATRAADPVVDQALTAGEQLADTADALVRAQEAAEHAAAARDSAWAAQLRGHIAGHLAQQDSTALARRETADTARVLQRVIDRRPTWGTVAKGTGIGLGVGLVLREALKLAGVLR